MLNSQETRDLQKRPTSIEAKSREIIWCNRHPAKAGVFRWVTNIHEHKRYCSFDNSLLFTESIQNTTQIFPR